MKISASCPECGQHYRVAEEHIGSMTLCKRCSRRFVLQVSPANASAAPVEAPRPLPPATLSKSAASFAESPQKTLPLGQGDVTAPSTPAKRDEQSPATLARFQIRNRLGVGAFSAVYRAYDPLLEREVALKLPHPSRLQSDRDKTRILREAKAAAQLHHPNIVPVYDAGTDGDQFFIASAFVEGQTLAECLEQQRPDFRRASEIVIGLASALEYAHRFGIVHRDVKPGNILLDAKGIPLLTDFGLARFLESDDQLTHDGTVLGTPAYMAPEQARGEHDKVGPASDQYSLGVVLYELLCGQLPFSGPVATVIADVMHDEPPSLRSIAPTIPKDLATICHKAMGKKPGDRYPSCQELAADLRRWQDGEPIRARRMGSAERLWRWTKRNPVLAGLALAVVVLAVLSTTAAVGLFQSRQELAQALFNEKKQTRIAEEQADLAAEKSRYAQEQEQAAKQNEKAAKRSEHDAIEQKKIAEKALADLQQETAARNAAETETKAEKEKRTKLTKELDRQGAKHATELKDVEKEKQQALEVRSWLKYTEKLAAADSALQGKEKDIALAARLLDECPKEHRAWEWFFLQSLCKGMRPVERSFSSGGEVQITPNVQWLLRLASYMPALYGERNRRWEVYELPNIRPSHICDVAGAPNLSPNGKHLLLAMGSGTKVYDIASGRLGNQIQTNRLSFNWTAPFSPDGTRVLLWERAMHLFEIGGNRWLLLGTGKPVVVPKLSLPTTKDFRGFKSFTPKGALVRIERLSDSVLRLSICEVDNEGIPKLPMRMIDLPMPSQEKKTYCASFSNNEKRVAIWEEESTSLYVFDVEPPRFLCLFDSKKDNNGSFVSFSPDGKRAAVRHNDDCIRLWDVAQKRKIPELRSLTWCNNAMPINDRSRIIISPDWTRVAVWKLSGRQDKDFDKNGDGIYYWSIPAPLDLGEGN